MVDLSQAQALEHTLEAKVEPRFLDEMGHMNVAWYVHLFDRAIWGFFERHGLGLQALRDTKRGMFAVEENLRYLSELREGDALHVHTGVLELRPKTLRLLQYMVDSQRQKVAAVREVIAVHIDLETRRSVTFADDVTAQLRLPQLVAPAAGPMTNASARQFAQAWVDAWNRRDLEAVLAHYAEDALFISPRAERLVGNARVQGKAALRAYWQAALAQIQQLEFVLDAALWSAQAETLTVVYDAAFQGQLPLRVVEIMRFQGGKIVRGEALYGAVVTGEGTS